jgi:acyl-CoA dehydrogenase
VQFGKPLAKLQAVQQMQAQIAGELALAEAIVDRAATGADLLAVAASSAMAKAVASEAAGKVAALAHQIHGAIGVSRQHELQHHTRALWAWRDERGAEDVWRKSVGERVLADGGAALWPALAQT